MNIKCPKCKTIFEASEDDLSQIKKLKCSVCGHLWSTEKKVEKDNLSITNSFKKILFLNIFILFAAILSSFLLRDSLEYIDIYWQSFFSFVDNLIPIK